MAEINTIMNALGKYSIDYSAPMNAQKLANNQKRALIFVGVAGLLIGGAVMHYFNKQKAEKDAAKLPFKKQPQLDEHFEGNNEVEFTESTYPNEFPKMSQSRMERYMNHREKFGGKST